MGLLHRVRKVKIVLLGQFTFRADCVWESLAEQTRLQSSLQRALTADRVCSLQ